MCSRTVLVVVVGGSNGKRILDLNQPNGNPTIQVDTFQDYQFYEVDENNLAKIGRSQKISSKWYK